MAVSGFRVQQIINPNTSALMHSPAPQKPRQQHQPLLFEDICVFSPTLLEALSQGHCSSMKIPHYGKSKNDHGQRKKEEQPIQGKAESEKTSG